MKNSNELSYARKLTLEEIRSVQLNILDTIDRYCEKNDLKYYITAGTLIGALRHRGYIPWDDDIDVVMLREDYDKFLSEFNCNRSDKIRCVTHEYAPDFNYSFIKVSDERTIFQEDEQHPKKKTIGVNVDIFPLENLTDDYEDAKALMRQINKYVSIVEVKNIISSEKRAIRKRMELGILKSLASFFSYKWLFKQIDRVAKKYIDNNSSKYITNAVIRAKGEKEILKREWFSESVDLSFEGRNYKAPVGYDAYMQRLFGEYMQLPPKEKRISHHKFVAYLKEGEQL